MQAIFVTVRTASSRLPRKCLKRIKDKCTIEYVIDRVKTLGVPVILCTSTLPEDDVLCAIALKNDIPFFRGSSEDKLMRWRDCAEKHNVDFFVSADGDDILVSTELISKALETDLDFIENKDAPCGAFSTGIRVSALNKVCEMKNTTDTEMTDGYFKTGLFKSGYLEIPLEYYQPDIRMTLDYEDDFDFFVKVINNVPEPYLLKDIIAYLDKNPEVLEINQHCQQMYLDKQEVTRKVVLK